MNNQYEITWSKPLDLTLLICICIKDYLFKWHSEVAKCLTCPLGFTLSEITQLKGTTYNEVAKTTVSFFFPEREKKRAIWVHTTDVALKAICCIVYFKRQFRVGIQQFAMWEDVIFRLFVAFCGIVSGVSRMRMLACLFLSSIPIPGVRAFMCHHWSTPAVLYTASLTSWSMQTQYWLILM